MRYEKAVAADLLERSYFIHNCLTSEKWERVLAKLFSSPSCIFESLNVHAREDEDEEEETNFVLFFSLRGCNSTSPL